jgi:regulatory protein
MKDPIKIALVFMKFRPRTVFEVEEKLKSKNISDEEIKKTVETLKNAKLLDDENFAKIYVGSRNSLNPRGAYLLKLELKRLGLKEEYIVKAMENQDEEELARRAIEMKNRYRNSDFNKKAQFLQRRGFSVGVIMKVLKSNNQ